MNMKTDVRQGKAPSELSVKSAMSADLFSCSPDDSIGEALAIMAERRVRRLPVLSSDRKPLGIITLADVVRWARTVSNPSVTATVLEASAAISALSPTKLHAAAE